MKEVSDSIKLGDVEAPAKMIDYDEYDYINGTIILNGKGLTCVKVVGIDEDENNNDDDDNNEEEESEQKGKKKNS